MSPWSLCRSVLVLGVVAALVATGPLIAERPPEAGASGAELTTTVALGPSPAGLPPQPGVDRPSGLGFEFGPIGDQVSPRAAQLASREPCQLPQAASRSDIGVGFPQHPSRVPTTGTLNITALFIDFADNRATGTTQARLQSHWPQAEEYLQTQSYGLLDVTMRAHHQWLNLTGAEGDYALGDGISNVEARMYISEAVALADPDFDFTGTDLVWMIPVSGTTQVGTVAYLGVLSPITAEGGAVTLDNVMIRGGGWSNGASSGLDGDELVAVHETMHTMGLVDLYWYGAQNYADQNRYVGNFDPMGSILGYPEGSWTNPGSALLGREILAWHRWQLDWIGDDQIQCQTDGLPVSAADLTALAVPDGTKALVDRVDSTRVVVAEARVASGYDSAAERSGVLVYTIDSAIASGSGPLQVRGTYPGLWASEAVLLGPGDRIDTLGRRVQVHAELGAPASAVGYRVGMAEIGDTDGSGAVNSGDVSVVLSDLVGSGRPGYLDWAGDLDGGGGTTLTDARALARCIATSASSCLVDPAP